MNRVFIIEDEIVVASSIKDILENNKYIVSGIATNYKVAIQKLNTIKTDLVLCDINLGENLTGIDLMQEVKKKFNLPFIFITAYSSIDIIKNAYKTSPLNYITKPFNEKQLLASIELAFQQLSLATEEFMPTDREKHIIQLLANGYSSKEIATKLSVSYYTVETHRKNLIKKFEVKNITELISKAMANSWITYHNQ